jgi:iron(III) transport system substrate-binding protein
MKSHATVGRRAVLAGSLLLPFGARVVSAAPPAVPVTPALIDAAIKEGKVTYYTAMDLSVAEPMAKAFEARYPGIKMAVERSGAERVFSRIGQEMGSKIYRVDVVNSSDAAHFIVWKREGWLAPFVSTEIARDVPAEMVDPDGLFCNQRTHLSVIAYNTKLVSPADAPKGFMDLLDPKYLGKMVKGHPGYSGTIMTATHQMARESAGRTSRSSASRRCCRSSPRPSRPSGWRRASAASPSTAATTCSGWPGSAVADRDRAGGRGHAADQQSDGHLQVGAQSQRARG